MSRPRSSSIRVGACALVAAAVLAACSGRGGGGDAGDVTNAGATAVPVVVDAASCEDYQPSPGVTADTITIGGSYPDSGPLANIGDVARGMKAYFGALNAQGGVNGRKIEFIGLDDQYDPTRTVTNINELLQKNQVFAIAGVQSSVGTTSVWDDLRRQCVPMMMSTMSGATLPERLAHLNVTDALVPYAEEGYAAGRYAAQTWKSANIAFLGQSGVLADSFQRGLRAGVAGSSTTVGAAQTYQVTDPTVTAQVTNLRASGADTLVIAASGTKCAQILDAVHATGWTPRTVISWTCSSATTMDLVQPAAKDGVVTASALRVVTPGDPESDRYLAAVPTYGDGVNPKSEGAVLGWTQGQLIAEALRRAPALTRVDLINSTLAFSQVALPMLQDGVTVSTSATDNTPFESVQMRTYQSATSSWAPTGDVVDLADVLKETEK